MGQQQQEKSITRTSDFRSRSFMNLKKKNRDEIENIMENYYKIDRL